MKSDVINVTNKIDDYKEVLDQAESVAAYSNLDHKMAMRLRLLVEEMMGMLHGLTGEKTAKFWIEATGKNFKLNLVTQTNMSSEMRKQLLSHTSSGKNVAAKGFMGKLRDIVERMLEPYDKNMTTEFMTGLGSNPDPSLSTSSSQMWSYTQYVSSLNPDHSAEPEAWDELEKSVVAKLADDIEIGIKGDEVHMIIYKSFAA